MTDNKHAFQGKPFLSIRDACNQTGLSMFYLRKGIKDGTIAAVRSGNKYLVNMTRLLESLDALPENRG